MKGAFFRAILRINLIKLDKKSDRLLSYVYLSLLQKDIIYFAVDRVLIPVTAQFWLPILS
jgi:hypothetical protein